MKTKKCKRIVQFKSKVDAKSYTKACGGRISKVQGGSSTAYAVKKMKRRKK